MIDFVTFVVSRIVGHVEGIPHPAALMQTMTLSPFLAREHPVSVSVSVSFSLSLSVCLCLPVSLKPRLPDHFDAEREVVVILEGDELLCTRPSAHVVPRQIRFVPSLPSPPLAKIAKGRGHLKRRSKETQQRNERGDGIAVDESEWRKAQA